MQPYPSAKVHQTMPTNGAPQQQALDDLLLGINEWRNIQDVVRITFKAFHDVLRQQGESIKSIERTLDSKAGRAEVSAALQQKANASEMAARLAELEMVLHKKADLADMDRRALKSEVEASLRTQMSDVFTIINTKSEAVETRALRESSERQLAHLSAEMSRLQQGLEDARAQLHTKASVVEVGTALSVKADLSEMEDKLRDKPSRRQVSDALALKADVASVDLTLGQMRQEVSDVAANVSKRAEAGRLEEVLQRVDRLRQQVEADSDTTTAALRTISSTFDEALANVQQLAREGEEQVAAAAQQGVREVEERMGLRMEESEQFLREVLSHKADMDIVERRLEQKADLEAMAEELEARADKDHVEELEEKMRVLPQLSLSLQNLQKDVANKMAADRAIYAALEGKANIEDVNTALLDVCRELERRAAHEHLDLLVRDQAALKAQVQQAHTCARWLWKSGQTKGGGAVPWNVQAVNTDPGNFVWEADKTVVMAMAPGLYKVEIGFYSKQRPIIQVLVDGEIVITVVNSSSTAIHHSLPSPQRGRPYTTGGTQELLLQGSVPQPHSAGNVTGTTCTDFLSLPARAKIAVTFHGEQSAEGFLSLQKL